MTRSGPWTASPRFRPSQSGCGWSRVRARGAGVDRLVSTSALITPRKPLWRTVQTLLGCCLQPFEPRLSFRVFLLLLPWILAFHAQVSQHRAFSCPTSSACLLMRVARGVLYLLLSPSLLQPSCKCCIYISCTRSHLWAFPCLTSRACLLMQVARKGSTTLTPIHLHVFLSCRWNGHRPCARTDRTKTDADDP